MSTEDFWTELAIEFERLGPTDWTTTIDRERPYNGQPHTDHGERGKQLVEGLTMRDIVDCFTRACFLSSGLEPKDWPGSIHDLPWDDMDIVAVRQNLTCEIERYMGIFPNVPRLLPVDPTEPHWCGWPTDAARWTSHHGSCDPSGAPR